MLTFGEVLKSPLTPTTFVLGSCVVLFIHFLLESDGSLFSNKSFFLVTVILITLKIFCATHNQRWVSCRHLASLYRGTTEPKPMSILFLRAPHGFAPVLDKDEYPYSLVLLSRNCLSLA